MIELLGKEYKEEVVDDYAKKIQNSKFPQEQTLSIVINGIKGYEGKRGRGESSPRTPSRIYCQTCLSALGSPSRW